MEAALNAKYNLDDPLPKQFLDYLLGVIQGDFGPSYEYTGKDVTDFIKTDFRSPQSLEELPFSL